MSYIGAQVENRISPAFIKEDFVGTGSATNFTLTNEVPGGAAQNVMVMVNNVVQEPDVAYTINDDASSLPKILAFTGNGSTTAFTLTEIPANATQIMVFVDGILQKSSTNYSVNTTTGVVTFTSAPDNSAEIEVKHLGIRTTARRALSMFLDNFTGNGSTTAFTLSNSASVNDVFVFYNGVAMKPTTDYGISGATLTFTFTPVASSQIMARYFV